MGKREVRIEKLLGLVGHDVGPPEVASSDVDPGIVLPTHPLLPKPILEVGFEARAFDLGRLAATHGVPIGRHEEGLGWWVHLLAIHRTSRSVQATLQMDPASGWLAMNHGDVVIVLGRVEITQLLLTTLVLTDIESCHARQT
jgi:hypothetical protein